VHQRFSRSCPIMPRCPFLLVCIRFLGVVLFFIQAVLTSEAAGQSSERLSVRSEVSPGPYLVGQGFELGVGMLATGQRPRIELPRINGAIAWPIDTDLTAIKASGIGSVVAAENRYVTRFRVLAMRSGPLEIPAIRVAVKNASGRTPPRHLVIQPVPVEGRPAAFLGSVGRFAVQAEAIPKVVRAGQELEFRIKVTGPAAWGMTDRPVLERFERLPIRPRIKPKPDETVNEPPSRTFVYGVRPTKAGDAVLPPVSIASYDPALSRYVTHVTASVPVRVVAVASFDPATIDDPESSGGSGRLTWVVWAVWSCSAMLLLAASAWLVRVRRRLRRIPVQGPAAARRYAARLARSLETGKMTSLKQWPAGRPATVGQTDEPFHEAARQVSDELIQYLQLGIGRPPGALTPDEAQEGVARLTDSEDLGRQAGRLTDRCDLVQYGHGRRAAKQDARQLTEDARGLFRALGRVKLSRRRSR
jgi:hypothetical protein